MKKNLLFLVVTLFSSVAFAQTSCDTATIYSNTTSNAVCFDTIGTNVYGCYSNNFPDHDDSYNSPFTVAASNQEYYMCLYPDTAVNFTPLYEETETPLGCNYTYQFGVAINGIGFTPNSNETFVDTLTGANNIEWHKEARYMFNANFGNNGGHINAFGSYHYHDVPVDYFTDSLGINSSGHSSIVGYAADGFPIYYKYVYSDPNNAGSGIVGLSSGYSLKSGTRPGDGESAPDGAYSGLYYEDYEYTATDLDSCNGRYGITPEYPNGTYYYVLTDNYPYIPRCFKGTVLDNTFRSLSNCPASTASTDCSTTPSSVLGCMDPFSCNYNPSATVDDGSCDYSYTYETSSENSSTSVVSPSGNYTWTTSGTYNDTIVAAGCDTVYTVTVTITSSSGCSIGPVITDWELNTTGKTASYWQYVGPGYSFNTTTDLADVLSVCYDEDTVWIESEGMTNDMGQFSNPGSVIAQGYRFKFSRDPVAGSGTESAPESNTIGVLLNGIPIYGLGDGKSYHFGLGSNEPNGDGLWVGEAYYTEGVTLDTAFAAHPQQSGAYHSHATPFRYYDDPDVVHSPLVGFANDGFPVYGPFGYSTALDSSSGVTRMVSGYALRNITTRDTLPDGSASMPPGPAVTSGGSYDIGSYVQDYEYLGTGTLDEHNGRLCVTPEYPNGTYAYFVTVDALGTPKFPYYVGTTYYGTPVADNNDGSVTAPSGVVCYDGTTCLTPVPNFSAGSTTICEGTSTVFTDASTNTPTTWSWSFTPNTVTYINTTSSTSQNPDVRFDAGGTYQVALTASNASGSATEIKIAYITVDSLPGDAGAITGSASECDNATGVSYSIAAVSGATGYTWTRPAGATVTSGAGTNSITINFGTTSGNVTVTPTNACGSGTSSSIAVTLSPAIGATGSITGSTTLCENATGVTYSIPAVTNASIYNWTVPTGASITSGSGTNSIVVTFGTNSGNVWVTPSNSCGNGTAVSASIALSTVPSAAGVISGDTIPCENATGVTYSISAVTGATGYSWAVPTGASITSGSGTNSIVVTFGTTSGNVTVTPTNACGNGTMSSAAIVLSTVPSAAGVISGDTIPCENATGVTYSIAAVAGATGYTWTRPAGASITSGAGTNSIVVTYGTTSGNITVTPTNACGNGTSSSIAVTLNSMPNAAGAISGPTTQCENASGVNYNISSVIGATGYTWTVPTGASITSGSGTNSIVVTFGTTSGNVTVTPTNTCGNGTLSSVAVTLNSAPGVTGVVTGDTALCENAAGVGYSISAITGATGYSWTVPAGASITSGSGTTNIVVSFGTTSGNVTVTPTFTCGNGALGSLAITLTSVDTSLSVVGLAISSNQNGATYQWIDCGNNNNLITGETNQSYTPSVSGSYAVIITSGGCSDTSTCYNYVVTDVKNGIAINKTFNIYPNPTKGELTIQLNSFGANNLIRVYDMLGNIIIEQKVFNKTTVIDLSGKSKGVYFVNVETIDATLVRKVILQ